MWILGEANRAKSFILKGLGKIFLMYLPPDTGSHRLMGCEQVDLAPKP